MSEPKNVAGTLILFLLGTALLVFLYIVLCKVMIDDMRECDKKQTELKTEIEDAVKGIDLKAICAPYAMVGHTRHTVVCMSPYGYIAKAHNGGSK